MRRRPYQDDYTRVDCALAERAWDGLGWTVMAEPLSPITAEFGARVRARREELGLSQEAAAVKCGVHWTFLGQVERGRRDLRLSNIKKLAAGLGTTAGELID